MHNTKDDGNSAGSGAEFALGNGTVGLGVGYYKNDCTDCKGRSGAIAGFGLNSFAAAFAELAGLTFARYVNYAKAW